MQNVSAPKFNAKFERQARSKSVAGFRRKPAKRAVKIKISFLNFPVPALGIARSVRGSYIA